MSDMDSSVSESSEQAGLVGATAASEPENQENKETLPMVVWLKGDEDYADAFCLDAEAAMKELGIRRSRLTQISGKELRVGRIRIDRYVRPVYRPIDIAEYKKWTRATATHMRSSSVLDSAAKDLQKSAEEMEARIQTGLEDMAHSLRTQIEEFEGRLNNHGEVTAETVIENVQSQLGELKSTISHIETSLYDEWSQVKEGLDVLTAEDLDVSMSKVNFGIDGLKDDQVKINDLMGKLVQLLTPLEEIREHLTQDLHEISPAISEIYTMLFESAAHTKESLEGQARFNRKMAETLGKIIECQREALIKQEAMLVRLGKMTGDAPRESRRHLRRRSLLVPGRVKRTRTSKTLKL